MRRRSIEPRAPPAAEEAREASLLRSRTQQTLEPLKKRGAVETQQTLELLKKRGAVET